MFWLWHYWTVGDLKDLDLFTVNILAGTNHLFWLTAILVYKYTFGSRIFVIISRAHHQMGSPAEVQLAGVWGKMEFHNILQILPLTASPVLPATQIVETAGSGTSLDIGGYCGSYNLPRGKFLPHSYLVHNKDIHFLKKVHKMLFKCSKRTWYWINWNWCKVTMIYWSHSSDNWRHRLISLSLVDGRCDGEAMSFFASTPRLSF